MTAQEITNCKSHIALIRLTDWCKMFFFLKTKRRWCSVKWKYGLVSILSWVHVVFVSDTHAYVKKKSQYDVVMVNSVCHSGMSKCQH